MKNKEELVQGLIANEATQYVEDDNEWLSSLDEDQLSKMSPVVAEEVTPEQTPEEIAAAEAAANPEEEEVVAPITTEAYIAAAPPEVQEALNDGVQLHQARKKALIDGLVANARCTFTPEALAAKPISELESIAALAGDISYAGQAPILTVAADDADIVPAPPQLFDLSRNADAA